MNHRQHNEANGFTAGSGEFRAYPITPLKPTSAGFTYEWVYGPFISDKHILGDGCETRIVYGQVRRLETGAILNWLKYGNWLLLDHVKGMWPRSADWMETLRPTTDQWEGVGIFTPEYIPGMYQGAAKP